MLEGGRKRRWWGGRLVGGLVLLVAASIVAVWATSAGTVSKAPAKPPPSSIKTVKVRQGPFAVGPYSVRYASRAARRLKSPNLNGYIVGMHARVVDRQGRQIPVKDLMLHHVVYKDDGRHGERRDPVCGGPGESFYGTGEENQTMRLPHGYGYRIRKGDRWETGWMLMNHQARAGKAYIEYTAKIDTKHRLKEVTPYWLRVTGCPQRGTADPIFDVPGGGRRGSTFKKTTTWRMPKSGTLIAAGAHAHGGSKDLTISQPRCGDRTLMPSRPLYGNPDHPYYHVLPVLHEPGPIDMSWVQTGQGIPVAKGERLRLSSYYDNEWAHTRVMGIMHLYVHYDRHARGGCRPLPRDLTNVRRDEPGRTVAPHVKVPLTGLDQNGIARRITRPPGPTRSIAGDGLVAVKGFHFGPSNLSVPRGALLRWRFGDQQIHNVTVAGGPQGFSSQNFRRGGTYQHRLDRPGTYRIFCQLHPVSMSESIQVRR